MGSPVFFRQRRPGLGGRPFPICKFRTMNQARDAQGNLLTDAQRLTRFGRFFRSTSLDELPELLTLVRISHFSGARTFLSAGGLRG